MSAEKPSVPLFPSTFISKQVQSQLPAGFIIRPLASDDFEKGFLKALSHLTTVGTISKAQFMDRFNYMRSHSHEYFTIVIEDTGKNVIAAAGTILIERKFVHENGLVGHIEDIVVHGDYRKLQFGRYIIEQLKHIGREVGSYKIILDCSEKNVPFYQKCGFTLKEREMALYIDQPIAKL